MCAVETKSAVNATSQSIAVQHLLEAAAERWPDSPSVSYEGLRFNWKQTRDRCQRVAWGLASRGVEPGDRVAYLGFNSHWCFELFFASPMAGAIFVPVNFRLSVGEMIACVTDAEPTVLVVDQHHLAQAAAITQACPWLKTVIYAGRQEEPWDMVSYERLLGEASPVETAPSGNDDTLVLFYTGGTTGRSKGVMLTHINQFTNALGGLGWYRMRERETHLQASPMFHTAAGSRVFTATMTGTHSVILSKFDVPGVMEAVAKERISTMQIVPTMLQMMLDHPDFSSEKFASLRLITYGASPMPVALLEQALEVLPGVSFAQSYGMTEASPVVTVLDSEDHSLSSEHIQRLESVGRPVFHNQVRIVDGRRRSVPRGSVGEIVVKGSNVMKGYWRAPDLTRDVLQDGWYYTGDSGYLDDAGYLFMAGRIKDMIVSGGENVYPIEIENILSRHPNIKECAVVGVPHNKWGESVHAVVRLLKPGSITEKEVIEYCRQRIAHYKCPTSVTFMEDAFPVSTINKVLKAELRKKIINDGR
ncbi:long-chain-fatty-acid--CoA ligase [Marinobacter salinexigens]|uniref:Long-chain-fatty-acid--CoA ligase n=1 Tax=Marinobacter salinexigens TaxID=2919747 RepID=A0A5B0VCE3_9GAMM|nr:long-chain-fatty-acid--CoA ligase [Marinobacter salinexigens]KAA1172300.1 long-chain-fatty-acid--CoA ligase [Marinobacter salinexigens]